MKSFGKKFTLALLICAATASPSFAQIGTTPDDSTNRVAVPVPPVPPVPLAPVAEHNDTSPAKPKRKVQPDNRPEVRIDSAGVFVGGPHPITVEIPQRGFGPSLATAAMILIGVMSPFVCIVVVCLLFLQFRHRRNRMLHETMRMMIEKGVPIPRELLVSPDRSVRRKTRSDLRTGLVILFFGLGVTIFLIIGHVRGWPLGLIFMLVGLAFLVSWKLEKKDAANIEAPPQ